jgi:hypothetical protein
MPIKLIMPVIGFAFFATSATANVSPPWWCFDTPDRGQFCGYYKAPSAELASIRAADEAEAKMCTAFDCVQSANNGIGSAVHVSRDVGFTVIKSEAIIDRGTVHHFTLIKAQ